MGGASHGKCHRKQPLYIDADQYAVRVKTCGKSARRIVEMQCGGKPYPEQGKIAYVGRLFRLNMRVCRQDKWLPPHNATHPLRVATESGLSPPC